MGYQDILPIGTVVDLSDYYERTTRRKFLGGLFASSVGLSTLVGKATGARPEGEPLVQTVGLNGEPRRVKIISQRRHSVLKRYENMSMDRLKRRFPSLRAVSVVPSDRDKSGLAFELIFDGKAVSSNEAEERAPEKLFGVPTVTSVETSERVPHSLKGGSEIWVDGERGTAAGVFYEGVDSPGVLTAEHVGPGTTIRYDGNDVGDRVAKDEATDTALFKLRDNVDFDIREMMSPLSAVNSHWTFSGITEEVSDGSLPVELYGAPSGHVQNSAVDTRRDAWYRPDVDWDYEVHMDSFYTQKGDSGAPWVEGNSLVAQHVGAYTVTGTSDYGVGTAAYETFTAVGATLYG